MPHRSTEPCPALPWPTTSGPAAAPRPWADAADARRRTLGARRLHEVLIQRCDAGARALLALLVAASAGLACGQPGATPHDAAAGPRSRGDLLPFQQQVTQAGLRATLQLRGESPGLVAVGQPLELSLRLEDEASGTPLRGLRPRLWMNRQNPAAKGADGREATPPSCNDQVRRLAAGRLSQRADRDLNGFRLLTLNADASLSVIDPLIALNNTKLEALVTLPGVGSDWVHDPRRELLFITLAERSELAVVDLVRHRLVRSIALGRGTPRRLALAGDRVWVAMDDSERLLMVDPERLELRGEIDIGAGLHLLATSEDRSRLVVTSSSSNRISVIDTAQGHLAASIPWEGRPLAVTYSALARRAWVAAADSGRIAVIDPQTGRLEASMAGLPGITALRTDPGGRHVLALSGMQRRLLAIDAAQSRVVGSVDLEGEADQIGFTTGFAYVRLVDSLKLTLVDLKALGEGRLALNTVPFFQRPPSAAARHLGPADMMAATPDPGALVVASPADTAIYYYTEGMMAPQGSYQTYRRTPRALMVVDRSLRETAPGTYTATVRLDRGGRYDLPLLIESPRLVHCFGLDAPGASGADGQALASEAGRPAARPQLRILPVAGQGEAVAGRPAVIVGAPLHVEVEVIGPDGQPIRGTLKDLQLMALELPAVSQQRVPLGEVAPGRYAAMLRLPRAGRWDLAAGSRSLGIHFETGPRQTIVVHEAPTPPADGAEAPPDAPAAAAAVPAAVPAAPPAVATPPRRAPAPGTRPTTPSTP